jgi:hypothetical protein
MLHLTIRRLLHLVVFRANESYRELPERVTAFDLLLERLSRPLPKQAQLELAHRALQSQQESIVNESRVIDPVIINAQRVGHGAQVDHMMPVAIVSRQPRSLQGEHGSYFPLTYRRQEACKSRSLLLPRTADSEIIVDNDDLAEAKLTRSVSQGVLSLLALEVVPNLLKG